MAQRGYIAVKDDSITLLPKEKNPLFTVFVMQSKLLFRGSKSARVLLCSCFLQLVSDAIGRNVIFIFSVVSILLSNEIIVTLLSSRAFLKENV